MSKDITPVLIIYDPLVKSYRFGEIKDKKTSKVFEIEDIIEPKRIFKVPHRLITRKHLPQIDTSTIHDSREINMRLRNLVDACKDFALEYKAHFYEVVLDRITPLYEDDLVLRGQAMPNTEITIGQFQGKVDIFPKDLVYPNFNLYRPI